MNPTCKTLHQWIPGRPLIGSAVPGSIVSWSAAPGYVTLRSIGENGNCRNNHSAYQLYNLKGLLISCVIDYM